MSTIRKQIGSLVLLSVLLQCISPFFAQSIYAQPPSQVDQRKKYLTDAIDLVEKRLSERNDQEAVYRIDGYDGTADVSKEAAATNFYADPFTALAAMFEAYFKGPAGTGPPADDPIKDVDFYGHPINYFKHHLNWVSQPDYDKKASWTNLQSDFETWKTNEAKTKALLDEYKLLESEVQKLRKEMAASGSREEASRIEAKIAEVQKKEAELRDKILELAKFRGRYGFVMDADDVGIARTIVITPQTAVDNGIPRFPYPFWKAVQVDTNGKTMGDGKPVDGNGEAADRERILFLCGKGLPTKGSDPANVTGDDPAIDYLVIATEKDAQSQGPDRKKAFEDGRKAMERNFDAETKAESAKWDAVLVRATLKRGVVPGLKDLKLNNLETSWELRFGDDVAELAFARLTRADTADPSLAKIDEVELTENIYLPERIFVEIRTEVAFPLEEIRLRARLNDKAVVWNAVPSANITPENRPPGQSTITAKFVGYEPEDRVIEVRPRPEEPGKLMKKVMAIYRTGPIDLYKPGEPKPPAEPGVYQLPADYKDQLLATFENKMLFRGRPPLAFATVYNDPSEVGMTWRHALTRAAKLDGYDVADWNNLEGKKAAEIANYAVTNLIIPNRKPGDAAEKWKLHYFPLFYAGYRIYRGDLKEKVTVSISDHAALLLFKDVFLKQMQEGLDQLEKAVDQDDRWEVGAWMDAIKPFAWDESNGWGYKSDKGVAGGASSPWRSIKVTGPKGGEVPFSFALYDSYLETTFGTTDDGKLAARAWSTRAGQEALKKYKSAIRDAITKARETDDKDVAALLKLLGAGYEAMIPHIAPRMMKLATSGVPAFERWRIDHNARLSLARLHVVVDAVRTQEEFSRLDSQFVLAMALALVTPFLVCGAATATVVAAAVEEFGLMLGPALVEAALFDIPDAVRQRNEIQFALGATLILGGDRLRTAEVNKTEWFEVGLKVLGGYFQAKATTVVFKGVFSGIQRSVSWVRTGVILSKVRRGGLSALKKLSPKDRAALGDFITEAKAIEKTDPLMMTSQQRRASALGEQLVSEALLSEPKPSLAKAPTQVIVEAKKEPGSVNAKGETVEVAGPNEKPETIIYDKAGEAEYPVEPPPAPPANPPPNPPPAARKWPNAPPPNAPFVTTTSNGRAVTYHLGELIAEGGYAAVYRLLDASGKRTGNVIKIFPKDLGGDIFATGAAVVENITNASRLLADTSRTPAIPQLAISESVTAGEHPYLIQKEITPDMTTFGYKNTVRVPDASKPGGFRETHPLMQASLEAFRRDEGLQRAVLKLFRDLVDKGLVWEDCHLGNIFFTKDAAGGKWIAGILDQDRIIKFSDRKGTIGLFFGIVEAHPYVMGTNRLRIRSLSRSPRLKTLLEAHLLASKHGEQAIFYPSAEFFMEKMLEYKDWVQYDPGMRQYSRQFIEPRIVEEYFPRINEGARNPPDLTRPNWRAGSRSSLMTRPRLNDSRARVKVAISNHYIRRRYKERISANERVPLIVGGMPFKPRPAKGRAGAFARS